MDFRRSSSAAHARPLRSGSVRAGVVAVLLASAAALAGCTPGPDPKPTPTPLFTSEADAFQAAEQVYREYVDATNANNDGHKDQDPLRYLAGTALDDAITGVRKREAAGTSVKGHVKLVDFHPTSSDISTSTARVDATVCVDVGDSRLENSSGGNVTPTDRAPRVSLNVRFSQSHEKLLITRSEMVSAQC